MASRLHFLSRFCRPLVKRVTNWILNEHSNGFTEFPDAAIVGSDLCQHHPHAFHGWGPGRQFGASWNSHGVGAGGLLSLAEVPSFRPARSRMAEPRSLCAVDWARVHVALFLASLDRSSR